MNPEHKKYIFENANKKSIKNIADDLHLKEKVVKRFLEKERRNIKYEKVKIIDRPAVINNGIDNGMVKKRSNLIFILLILIVGLAAYSNSFSNQFVWDDVSLINNTRVESFSAIKYIFREDLFHASGQPPTGYYRPIQIFSYMIDYFLWKRNPLGYHITSFIIQILNSFLVFYLCFLILKEQWKSFFIASLFCVHPTFVPIVAYVSGRADLLGLFFALSAILLIIKYITRGKEKTMLVLGIMFYPLAILSKEYYMIAPLFLLLYLYIFKSELKIDMATKIILFCMLFISAVYIFLRLTVLNFHQKMGYVSTLPFLTRVAFFPYVLTRYIITFVFPVNLGMENKMIYSSLVEPRFIFSYITPLLIGAIFYYLYKRKQKNNLFFLGWFIVGVIPISNLLMPLKTLYANHWAYMASIGFFAILLSIADSRIKSFRIQALAKTIRFIFPITAIIFFIFLSFAENRYWKNEQVFYEKLVNKGTTGSRPKYNLGTVYEEKGDYKKALELYNSAIEEFGEEALYFYSRGMLHKKMGDIEKARHDLEVVVKIDPLNVNYHNNLAGIYSELGMLNEARAQLKEALKLDPNNELACKNLDLIGEQ